MQAKEKGGQILLSAGYVVLGGLLIWRPDGSAKVIGWAVGIAALLYGVLHLINYWRTQRMGDGGKSELFLGITFAALGIFCLITPQTVLSFLPFLLGLVLVVDAVGKAQRALEFRRLGLSRWWLALLLAICLLVLGVVLLFNPFGAVRLTMIFFGACLLGDGILDIVALLMTR